MQRYRRNIGDFQSGRGCNRSPKLAPSKSSVETERSNARKRQMEYGPIETRSEQPTTAWPDMVRPRKACATSSAHKPRLSYPFELSGTVCGPTQDQRHCRHHCSKRRYTAIRIAAGRWLAVNRAWKLVKGISALLGAVWQRPVACKAAWGGQDASQEEKQRR